MKSIKSLIWIATIAMLFASCNNDEIIRESTHTDASILAEGVFSGTLSDGQTEYTDVIVTLTKIANDSIQAVSANVASVSFANLDVTGYLNVANANGVYYLSSGLSETQKMTGKIDGNNLDLNVPLSRKSDKLSNAQTGVVWSFVGSK
jgi:PBP1b-binding outer membrane lipoprotein LpoB